MCKIYIAVYSRLLNGKTDLHEDIFLYGSTTDTIFKFCQYLAVVNLLWGRLRCTHVFEGHAEKRQ